MSRRAGPMTRRELLRILAAALAAIFGALKKCVCGAQNPVTEPHCVVCGRALKLTQAGERGRSA